MDAKLIRKWEDDEKSHFEGWDFGRISKRSKWQRPTWDYVKIARRLVKKSHSLLDVDTGGGEILLELSPLPEKVVATEGWKPNIKVARKTLKRAGAKVFYARPAGKLPFKDESFDLVLNRHAGINAKEVYRVLKEGGIFFTQQVDARRNVLDLIRAFDASPKWTFSNLRYWKKELERLGFKIKKAKEWEGKVTFNDVGAIVYFLKNTPWLVDNFSVKTHLRYLERLETRLEREKALSFALANYMLLAIK